jgi:Na+/alanine symporter
MNENSAVRLPENRNALLAIAVGGLSAGIIDLAQALILFGMRVPLGIAAGLLGRQAAHAGGVSVYVLGVVLHFFIATSAAAVYYMASRKLEFLKEHWLICGLIYGAIVDQLMTLIVLPLSALHARGPYELHDLLLGISVHMITVGLPISFSIRRFAK